MMKRKRLLILLPILLIGAGWLAIHLGEPEYGYMPPERILANPSASQALRDKGIRAFDLPDGPIPVQGKGNVGAASGITPETGAVQVDEKLLALGRKTLYKETFGNEVFMTDVLGILDGPIKLKNITKALLDLKGKGTSNLRVELDTDATIGGRSYKKGDKFDTGIDVAQGSYLPLGLPLKYSEGRVKIGVTCMACHATVDPETKQIVEGAPNADFNVGQLMALAPNTASFFTHTDVRNLVQYVKSTDRRVTSSEGKQVHLPDPDALEKAVDENFSKWTPGSFDTTPDLVSNMTQMPDIFTKGKHPYSWSGFAMAGNFKGLSTFSNNVHAQNTDPLSQLEVSSTLFGIDKEVFIGTILQNASNPRYRYDPASGLKPSEFHDKIDRRTPGVPGFNESVKSPQFPKMSPVAPNGLFIGTPGYKANEQVNAMAAYQNTIKPPEPKQAADPKTVKLGAEVFRKAQCISCHAGDSFTNHRIVPSSVIGTEPTRARSFAGTERKFGPPVNYMPDTPIPIPKDAKITKIPTGHLDPGQLKLGFAHQGSEGGYKVMGLIGLPWSAPYLHDGGVAVGPELPQLGISGTLFKGILPDPYNSLKAMIDQKLRQRVIEANRSDARLRDTHVTGQGHEFWVDENTGFTKEQQNALIQYLLQLKMK
ncbi:electron transport protein [Paenibacillus sp. DMB20]|uniref:electron transport protein n=1 Tax=Paenibacillus sp. DMB20 TaxID=1642570 RepID=UPI000AED3CB8|nr:electron transport protein [Paenibacillus sp. DMB20]